MFSSLVSYVSSSLKGLSPKAWLARYIARALNEFFVLDKDYDIEANLLQDTKIVLHQVTVRTRNCGPNACLYGTIDEMELSWTWGGASSSSSASSTFVRDTRLAIRGAQFRIIMGGQQQQMDLQSISVPTTSSTEPTPTSEPSQEGYVQRHLQQIMDHLTLDISDVMLVLEEDQHPRHKVCLQTKGLQLVSFGREDQAGSLKSQASASFNSDDSISTAPPPPPLAQRISLESICAFLKPTATDTSKDTTNETVPLLDPIGYAASVKRVAGRRFLDGWATGLEIVGEVLVSGNNNHGKSSNGSSPPGFVVHAGAEQVKTLARIMERFASPKATTTESLSGGAELTSRKDQTADDAFYDCHSETSNASLSSTATPTTTVMLPLPSITVWLSDVNTNICMPQCSFAYHVDGTVCRLHGNQGIWMGGENVIAFDASDEDCGWAVDFITQKAALKRSSCGSSHADYHTVAHLEWNDEVMKQVVHGFHEIAAAIPSQIVEQVEAAVYEYSSSTVLPQELDEMGTSWSFETNGPISLKARGQDGYVQARVGPVSLELSSGSTGSFPFSRFDVAGATIGPTSFGETKSSVIEIPCIRLQEDTSGSRELELKLSGNIQATLESKQVVHDLQEFYEKIIDFQSRRTAELPAVQNSNGSSSIQETVSIPMFSIPGMRLTVVDDSLDVVLEDVAIGLKDDNLLFGTCGDVKGWQGTTSESKDGALVSISGITVKSDFAGSNVNMHIQSVGMLRLPDLLDGISEPISNVTVAYTNGVMKVHCSSPIKAAIAAGVLEKQPQSKEGLADERNRKVPNGTLVLPCQVQLRLTELKLLLSATKSSLSFQPFNFSVTTDIEKPLSALSMELLAGESTAVRLDVEERSQGHCWLEASLAGNHHISLQPSPENTYQVQGLKCGTIHIGPSSREQVSLIDISGLSMSTVDRSDGLYNPELQTIGCVKITLQSKETMEYIQSLILRAAGRYIEGAPSMPEVAPTTETPTPRKRASLLVPEADITIQEPHLVNMRLLSSRLCANEAQVGSLSGCIATKVPTLGNLSIEASLVKVSSPQNLQQATLSMSKLGVKGSEKLAASFMDIGVKFDSSASAFLIKIPRINTLRIPGNVDVSEPILETVINFSDGSLKVQTTAVIATCPLLASKKTSFSGEQNASDPLSAYLDCEDSSVGNSPLPCRMELKVQKLKLRASTEAAASLWVANLAVVADPADDALTLKIPEATMIRIVDSVKNTWIQAEVGPLSVATTAQAGFVVPNSATCASITVGPCSFGKLEVVIPSIDLNESKIQTGEISGSLVSMELIQQAQSLWDTCFPSQVEPSPCFMPFTVEVPRAVLKVAALNATAIAEQVSLNGFYSSLSCGRFGIQDENGLAAAFSGVRMAIYPTLTAEIGTVDCFYIPDSFSIERPVQSPISVYFEDDTCCLHFPPVDVIAFASEKEESDNNSAGGKFEVPFPVRLNLQRLTVKSFSQEGEITSVDQLAFHLRPLEKDRFATDDNGAQDVLFHAVMSHLENKLIELSKTSACGMISGGDFSTIHRFKLETESAEVAAGFSSVEWASIFGKEKTRQESPPIALPLCCVEPFTVHLQYRGRVVGVKNTAVSIKKFVGGPSTDSKDVIQHLQQAVLSRAPAMLTNAQIFGQSVSEMAATTAGGAALAAGSMPMVAAGCAAGLAAHDSVRGAISSGKKSRHATAGDKYEFGDFSRGVVHSVKHAAKSGGEARRGSGDGYQLGDFAAGASKSVANYAGENKSRLGSVSGSAAGMMVGCAVAGPLGLVAGSLLGSRVGRDAFGKDAKKQSDHGNQTQRTDTAASHQPSRANDADLLGMSQAPSGNGSQDAAYVQRNQPGNSLASTRAHNPSPGQWQTQTQPQHGSGCIRQANSYEGTADLLGFGNDNMSSGSSFPQEQVHWQIHRSQQQQQQQQQRPMHHNEQQNYQQQRQHQSQYSQQQRPHVATPQPTPQQPQKQGYRFGDLTKGVIAKGKTKSGRSDSESYKFGDFTRGLFK